MKLNTEVKPSRFLAALVAGILAATVVSATGIPLIGHVANVVVFCVVMLYPSRPSLTK